MSQIKEIKIKRGAQLANQKHKKKSKSIPQYIIYFKILISLAKQKLRGFHGLDTVIIRVISKD